MMVQLITFLVAVVALVVLVLQNLSPVLPLVVLGRPLVALPLSLWLLGAIAIGVLCTLLIYQLVPQRRAYRPMGKRLSDPIPEPKPTRGVDSTGGSTSDRFQAGDSARSPYDSDWESFRAPEQWEDWGQQQTSARANEPSRASTAEDTMRDIESGWDDGDYVAESRRPSYEAPREIYREETARQSERPRTYEEGWLYGNESADTPPADNEPGEPVPDESDDVYDANYRVIIPPYDTKDS
ncbi:MAG: hypothetical protein ACFB2W_21860 [Leptolyngbyaceae cyanobacterium]